MNDLQILLQNINIIHNRIKTIDELMFCISEEKEFIINEKHFTDISEYNKLMDYLKSINVSVETSLEYYDKLDKSVQDASESIKYVSELLVVHPQYKMINVSNNGIISEMTQLVVKVYDKKEMSLFVDHIIKICYLKQSTLIFIESNASTSPKYHSNNTQYIATYGNKTVFEYFKDKKPIIINFLTWIVQTIPLLLFYVPYNLMEENNFESDGYKKSIHLLTAGISFYRELSKKINLKIDSNIDKVLYTTYTDIEKIKQLFDWYSCTNSTVNGVSNQCTLSRFPIDDGFSGWNPSTVKDYKTHKVFNTLYSHRYLDSRHLSTILLGTPRNNSYRNDIKEIMLYFVTNDLKNKGIDIQLQYFTRIKLVLYELSKLDSVCQKIFNENIIKLF